MKRLGKICRTAGFVFCFCLLLAGCEDKESEAEYKLYYLNENGIALEQEDYIPTERITKDMVAEVMQLMQEPPQKGKYSNLLPETVQVLGYDFTGSRVVINFSKEYEEMKNTREIMVRAGFVKALVQIPGVTEVEFKLEGGDMYDSQGQIYPIMTADSFVGNEGKNINAYQYTTLKLYFGDRTGEKLAKEEVTTYYSSNVSLERVVVEQLLKGPREETHQRTIPSETKILGVTVAERVCYVNLDSSFNGAVVNGNMSEEIPIYSIVNSILNNCPVSKVQISINGETDVMFRDSITLNQYFTRNMGLVQKEENE